jgi:molybdate transport system regulatory protein
MVVHVFANDGVLMRQSTGTHFSIPPGAKMLDSVQLAALSRAFHAWAENSPRPDVRRSRERILLIFLLIRYTGAKLHEILELKATDISLEKRVVMLGKGGNNEARSVEIPDDLVGELRVYMKTGGSDADPELFRVDPGHVRRKFYEQAEACGLPREFGNPSALRRSRSIELLRGNLPLPVVQKLLGHSTPNLTASLLDVSEEDMHHVVRLHIDRESRRRTSARNTFFGKVIEINRGDIQSEVVLHSLGGLRISSVITNNSLKRMRLRMDTFVTAEIKAPWVHLAGKEAVEKVSSENRLQGTVQEITIGRVNTEVLLRLVDGTEICAVITSAGLLRLGLQEGDQAWALFEAYAVILNIE